MPRPIRQVLYAPDSPTTVPPLKITEIEPFFDEKTRVELAQLQMKIDQWNLEATVRAARRWSSARQPTRSIPASSVAAIRL